MRINGIPSGSPNAVVEVLNLALRIARQNNHQHEMAVRVFYRDRIVTKIRVSLECATKLLIYLASPTGFEPVLSP
jgi:hypothetical protein